MSNIALSIFKNKVVWYVATRYATYALQFIISMYIAIKLGPYGFGIWSFILLLINYFNIVDFGISNSVSILLVQDKDSHSSFNSHISSSIILTILLNIFVIANFLALRYFSFSFVSKYSIDIYLPIILYIVSVKNFNKVFSSIYRVKNRLVELALFQTMPPLCLLIAFIFMRDNSLWPLLWGYVGAHTLSFIVFICRGEISFKGLPSLFNMRQLLIKGLWLFLYNASFYLIMFSSSSFISSYYTIEEFGKFNFAYTLGNAILLFLEAFGYIIFPKIIHKLKGNDFRECCSIIEMIRSNYLTVIHGFVYLAFPVFLVVCWSFPKYGDIFRMLSIAALTILPYTNAFGLNTFLMAQNKERQISFISLSSLSLNIILLFILGVVFKISYDIILISTLISYILFTSLCAYFSMKRMDETPSLLKTLRLSFPIELTIPYVVAVAISISNLGTSLPIITIIPLLIFCSINFKKIMNTGKTLLNLIHNPQVIDLK